MPSATAIIGQPTSSPDPDPGMGLLRNVERIYLAARESEDGLRCCVAPHPELQKQLVTALEKARGGADPIIRPMLQTRSLVRVGFNDGLVVPGDQLPLGTSPSVARAFAMERAPLTGNVRVIVVLVDFPDQVMAQTRQHFNDLFFSTGVLPNGSVREYYSEVTNNQVTIVGDVVGPFRMPHAMTFYANNAAGTGGASPNARDMARDAANAANPSVNFAPYDNDGNGYVDAFIVVHAGPAAEVTGNNSHIWSHKWVLPSEMSADGTKVFAYLTVPEDCKIGVCAHELGHLLFGFPDLYDTDYSSSGVGDWCLMGGGSWNGGGDVPAHPSAWCKCNQGWAATVNQTTNATVSIADVKTGRQVYRLWKNGAASTEYFLVENRQRTKYDRFLPGDGLLIWHIDETVSANSDERHPKVALLQADGANHLATGANRGDAGDPFPGSSGNTGFNATSNPNSKSYGSVATCVSVSAIGASGPTMTARLAVACAVAKPAIQDKLVSAEKTTVSEKRTSREKSVIRDKSRFSEKRIEKPFTEKGAAREKPPGAEGGSGASGWQHEQTGASELAALWERVAELEAALAAIGPFIPTALRPDISGGAMAEEETGLADRMAEGDGQTKRLLDTGPRHR